MERINARFSRLRSFEPYPAAGVSLLSVVGAMAATSWWSDRIGRPI
jgi:hypothetical protein